MPTTTYSAPTISVAAIGGRTDTAGDEVPDYTAEEARLITEILEAGYLKPAGAWQVRAQAAPNMSVRVGSGTAKRDHYVVAGRVAGQGKYIVRLDASSVTLAVPAADASQPRTDEIYLVVLDNSYDATTRGLPQLGYRRGDLGGAAPGPDSSWEAYELLGTVQVAAGALSIAGANITDGRSAATLVESLLDIDTDDLITKALVNAKGDLIVGTASDVVTRLGVGSNGQALTADSSQTGGMRWWARNGGTDNGHTSQTTNTTTWVNASAVDPVVIDVGPSGLVLGSFTVGKHESDTDVTRVGIAATGANTLNAGLYDFYLNFLMPDHSLMTRTFVWGGLNPGSTTFRLQFCAESAGYVAGIKSPSITVVAL